MSSPQEEKTSKKPDRPEPIGNQNGYHVHESDEANPLLEDKSPEEKPPTEENGGNRPEPPGNQNGSPLHDPKKESPFTPKRPANEDV